MIALRLSAALLAFTLGHAVSAQDRILGTWLTQSGQAKISIYPCAASYCGRIVWLKEPNFQKDDEAGYADKPKTDRHNPDVTRRSDPVMGKEILRGLVRDSDDQWSGGEIYDTKSGKTYQCKATLTPEGTLRLRGFIGISLLGRTEEWLRVED